MSTQDDLLLADQVEAAIRAVDGVDSLYRAGTTLGKMTDAGARLLGIRDAVDPLVCLNRTGNLLKIEAAIGLNASRSAPATLHQAQLAVTELLEAVGGAEFQVCLTVVRVE